MRNANRKYHLANVDDYAELFLCAVSENRLTGEDLNRYPEFVGLIDGYKKVCCVYLAKHVIELNRKEQSEQSGTIGDGPLILFAEPALSLADRHSASLPGQKCLKRRARHHVLTCRTSSDAD